MLASAITLKDFSGSAIGLLTKLGPDLLHLLPYLFLGQALLFDL